MLGQAVVGNERKRLNPPRASTRGKVSGCSNLRSSCGEAWGWEEEAAHMWTSERGLRSE